MQRNLLKSHLLQYQIIHLLCLGCKAALCTQKVPHVGQHLAPLHGQSVNHILRSPKHQENRKTQKVSKSHPSRLPNFSAWERRGALGAESWTSSFDGFGKAAARIEFALTGLLIHLLLHRLLYQARPHMKTTITLVEP